MKRGLDWYHRKPVNYLGGVQGLTAREHAVYGVVLDLIYVHGGYINNDPGWIAGWISDMGAAAVRRTIASLAERGKIIVADGLITQRVALEVCENQRKTRGKPTENLAKTSGKPGKTDPDLDPDDNGTKDLGPAADTPREDKKREDKGGANAPPKGGRSKGCRIPDGWRPSAELGAWAMTEFGWNRDQVSRLADEFVDYWRALSGTKACKLDWDATFRNRCRDVAERRPPKPPTGGQPDDRLARKIARFSARPEGCADSPDRVAGGEDRDAEGALLPLRIVGHGG